MLTNPKALACIIAYQDLTSVRQCVYSIWGQSNLTCPILIIDNSPRSLDLSDLTQSTNDLVTVLHHPENIGIAGGLVLAIEWSIAQGYDFLWIFDQDSTPEPDCLSQLLQVFIQLSQENIAVGIIAPTAIETRTGEVIQPANFCRDHFQGFSPKATTAPFECDAPITSGSLISLKAAQLVAPPDQRLFIDAVDLEFGLRLKQAAFHNFVVPSAILNHHFGTPKVTTFLGQKKVIQVYSGLRHFYISRNYTYLELKFSRGGYKVTCGLKRIKRLLFSIVKILLFDPDQKIQKVSACLLGTWDGFTGNLNRKWLP